MNILAINTAFPVAHLALEVENFHEKSSADQIGRVKENSHKEGGENGERGAGSRTFFSSLDSNCKHSENVLAEIDALCSRAGVDILDVDTLAVVVGPGSFTGLRIGVAIARALGCVNKNLRFVAISSLELLAFCAQKQHKICQNFACAINALSNLCFVAYFDTKGIILYEEKLLPLPQLVAQDLPKFVLKGDFPAAVGAKICAGVGAETCGKVGEVCGKVGDSVSTAIGSAVGDEMGAEVELSPQTLLEFAKKLAAEGKFVSLQNLLPKYIRLSQAEDNLNKKNQQ